MSMWEQMGRIVSGEILPVPQGLAASHQVGFWFTIWAAGLGVAVIPWGIYRLLKYKDDVPLWMIAGGFLCSLLEPMLDHLGHLWWPENLPGAAFVGYDLHVPWLIPPCYVFFISMTGYWAYTRMKAGLDLRGFFLTWLLISMTDLALEIPGTATGAYVYYGDASFKMFGFPLAWSWLNGTSMLTVGALLWAIEPRLKNWRRAALALVSISAMGATYGVVAWPYFLSLNWDMSWPATRAFTLVSLALAICMVRFLAVPIVTRTTSD